MCIFLSRSGGVIKFALWRFQLGNVFPLSYLLFRLCGFFLPQKHDFIVKCLMESCFHRKDNFKKTQKVIHVSSAISTLGSPNNSFHCSFMRHFVGQCWVGVFFITTEKYTVFVFFSISKNKMKLYRKLFWRNRIFITINHFHCSSLFVILLLSIIIYLIFIFLDLCTNCKNIHTLI